MDIYISYGEVNSLNLSGIYSNSLHCHWRALRDRRLGGCVSHNALHMDLEPKFYPAAHCLMAFWWAVMWFNLNGPIYMFGK